MVVVCGFPAGIDDDARIVRVGPKAQIINRSQGFEMLLERAGRYLSGRGLRGCTGQRILSNEGGGDGEPASRNHG